MKNILFKGVGTAIATPFDENGINITEFIKLLNFQLDNGVDSIIVCGTTGEVSTLTDEEKILLIETTVKIVNKKVPVIVGTRIKLNKKNNCRFYFSRKTWIRWTFNSYSLLQ